MEVPLAEIKDVEDDLGASLLSPKVTAESLSIYLTHGDSSSFIKPSPSPKGESVSSGEGSGNTMLSLSGKKSYTSLRELSDVGDLALLPRGSSRHLNGSSDKKRSLSGMKINSGTTPMPQKLTVSVSGQSSQLSGTYTFDSMRGGSAVWLNGLSTIRKKGHVWEIREGYGEASTKIASNGTADNKWPHEMRGWTDSHGYKVDAKITSKDLQKTKSIHRARGTDGLSFTSF